MGKRKRISNPFNSPLEVGVRSVCLLVAMYPKRLGIQTIVDLDYLVLHTRDAGGPSSLHPPLPHRTGEVLVKVTLIRTGLQLMQSKKLVEFTPSSEGFLYSATESSAPFINNMRSTYLYNLKERANWVALKYAQYTSSEIREEIRGIFKIWTTSLQNAEYPSGS